MSIRVGSGGGGGHYPVGPEAIPPAELISTYQIRGTKLHFMLARLLGFMLGNRGGDKSKTSLLLPKESMLTVCSGL